MDFLGRDDAPFDGDFWAELDATVVSTVSGILTGRRVIPLCGPLGASAQVAKIDGREKTEEFAEGFVKTTNRKVAEIPQLYSDFWLNWRDLDAGGKADLSSAAYAAQKMAQYEDSMIFYGIPALGLDGLLTVKGSVSLPRGDWGTGENAFTDVAAAMTRLEQNGYVSDFALVVSPDLFLQLQRIQPGTGILEIDRIKGLVGKKVLKSTMLKEKTALLLSAGPYCVDLLVGQDIITAYVEAADLNHHFRILETALLRIKCPDSIVVFSGKGKG